MTNFELNIISTEMDLELFTNRKYQNKVRKILDKIKEQYQITEKYAIACHKNWIEMYLPNRQLMLVQELLV